MSMAEVKMKFIRVIDIEAYFIERMTCMAPCWLVIKGLGGLGSLLRNTLPRQVGECLHWRFSGTGWMSSSEECLRKSGACVPAGGWTS